ncbi:MAG: hypothetical protein KJ077_34750 [Anaerolineae bacterium]|nr:hypothetical protein [Anaerolineae bacterium]
MGSDAGKGVRCIERNLTTQLTRPPTLPILNVSLLAKSFLIASNLANSAAGYFEVVRALVIETYYTMKEKRFFHLRHPKKFSSGQFKRFQQNCIVWQQKVLEQLQNWSSNPVLQNFPVPEYEFGAAELSEDRLVASLPIDGEASYIGVKLFEDYFPEELWQGFPFEFLKELEVGYSHPGFLDEPNWRRLSIKELNPGEIIYNPAWELTRPRKVALERLAELGVRVYSAAGGSPDYTLIIPHSLPSRQYIEIGYLMAQLGDEDFPTDYELLSDIASKIEWERPERRYPVEFIDSYPHGLKYRINPRSKRTREEEE